MKYFFAFLYTIYSFSATAQSRVIAGTVYDMGSQSQEALIGASVCLLKDTSASQRGKPCIIGTQTDLDGNFSFEYDSRYNYIEFYYTGYVPRFFKISALKDSLNTISLYPDTNTDLSKTNTVTPYKPAIYLYPLKPTTISVIHHFKGTIGTTYPDYKDGWHVKAQPDGTILNLADNREYEYLFWDGTCTFPDEHFAFKDGFVVHKKDLADFFLNKLSLIGLNNKEMNDFIVYWLPMLNKSETNFIHFRINDNIDNASVLTVSPEPESWIRLFMEYKEVSNDFTIPEQQLKTYPRKGFTLVEWGGSSIGKILKIL